MRILITGGAGFVGHHLIEHIWKFTDWEVVSLDRLDTSGTLTRLTDIKSYGQYRHRLKVVHHDLRAELNEFVVKQIGPINIVLHVAAASHVDRSIEDPMGFVQDNVVGTVNLLNFTRRHWPLAQFLYFSTDEVFGPAPKGVAYAENDRYNSGNPYAASKAAAEEFCVAFANTYNLGVVITHTMNVFGERQHPEKFIPRTISKVLKGEKVLIHADATKTVSGSRFYIHARNVAAGVLFVLKTRHKSGEKFNIVGEREVSNLELAQQIASNLGMPLHYELVDFHSSRPGHDLRYALSGAKLKAIGWEPPMTFERSLESTIAWTVARRDTWLD